MKINLSDLLEILETLPVATRFIFDHMGFRIEVNFGKKVQNFGTIMSKIGKIWKFWHIVKIEKLYFTLFHELRF